MGEMIQAGDVRLHVEQRGSGRPLLLVHGFPLDHTMWRGQLDALADAGHVIAPDLRGLGRSEATGPVVTMKQFADDLAALLDALGVRQPVVFCGLSMGGYIGWEFWRKHQQRVASLILCDTRAAPDSLEAAAAREEAAETALSEGTAALVEGMLPKLLAASTLEQQPEIADAVRRMIEAAPPVGVAAALRGMAQRRGGEELLAEINVPALLIVGREDPISPPSEMQSMAKRMSQARLTVIEDAGHLAPLEQSEPVNAAIRAFLAELT